MDAGKICDLCAGSQFEIICRRDRRGKPLDTSVCLGCGLVGHAVIPTEEELADYYSRSYRKDYHGEDRPSNRRIWRAYLKGQRVVRDLGRFLTPGDRVFEVGAGIGCNVKSFEWAGFDASGIEPGATFQRFARNELQARIAQSSVFEYQARADMDMVLFIHVIEHMRSPRRTLQAIHRLLQPTGRLYLECPSLAKECGNIAELFHFAHIYTFTPITLLTLLRQTGFTLEKCFSDGIGCNHKFLLAKTQPDSCPIDPFGIFQTREILSSFRAPWHRFGFRYIAGRVKRISGYVQEFLHAKRAVREILRSPSDSPFKQAS